MSHSEILKCIINDIAEPISYIPNGMIWGLVLAFFALGYELVSRKMGERIRWYKVIGFWLLGIYVYVFLMQGYFSRPYGSRTSVNMEILGTWAGGAQGKAYVLENVLMFLPFGVLLPFCFKQTRLIFCIVPLAFMVSTLLEYAQYLTGRGHCQADDVLMNTLGAAAGYLLFTLVYRIRKAVMA